MPVNDLHQYYLVLFCKMIVFVLILLQIKAASDRFIDLEMGIAAWHMNEFEILNLGNLGLHDPTFNYTDTK